MGAQSPAMVAGRVYLRLDGRVVAQCVGISYVKNPDTNEEFGLDDSEAQEIAPGVIRVFGSVALTRRIGDGGADGLGFTAPRNLFVSKKYSTMELVDGGTLAILFLLDGSVYFGQESWQMQAKGTMAGAVAFRSKASWLNEATGAG